MSDTKMIFVLMDLIFQVEETDNNQNFEIITSDEIKMDERDLLLVIALTLACVRIFGPSFLPQFCRVRVEAGQGGGGQ